jgi:transposase
MVNVIAPEIKAKAIALLLDGNNAVFVSKETGVSQATIRKWSRETPEVGEATADRIRNLIVQNLETSMGATAAIAEHVKDKEWLMQQDAQQLAVLYGVMTDKSVRILEAMSTANAPRIAPKSEDNAVDGEVSEG